MEQKVVYFERTGRPNTDDTLRIARQRADELGVNTILVATTGGNTAAAAMDVFEGYKVVAVTHSTGFREPNSQELTPENREYIESKGGKILTTTHAFSGMSRAVRKRFETYVVGDIVASTLRLFGEGTKVAVEIAMMAADAGLARTDEQVVAIAGTGRGADTALVLRPVHSQDFFSMKVQEVLCKPHF